MIDLISPLAPLEPALPAACIKCLQQASTSDALLATDRSHVPITV